MESWAKTAEPSSGRRISEVVDVSEVVDGISRALDTATVSSSVPLGLGMIYIPGNS
jgi:hypothetical protein